MKTKPYRVTLRRDGVSHDVDMPVLGRHVEVVDYIRNSSDVYEFVSCDVDARTAVAEYRRTESMT